VATILRSCGNARMIPQIVLNAYGLDHSSLVQPFGSGHIHKTYKVTHAGRDYILQRINHFVFTRPDQIITNITLAAEYLKEHFPEYPFLSILKAKDGSLMVYDEEQYPWRLLPYIANTYSVNEVSTAAQAFEAARGFAQLTRNLDGIDTGKFSPTLDRFHDLTWRYKQFQTALAGASEERLQKAQGSIDACVHFLYLVNHYQRVIKSGDLILRITHNDTKINNILFDQLTHKTACVIDLDTLMPGYFIYDLGDMVRTFVSPVSEEEAERSKIIFRKEIYEALVSGYLSEMKNILSERECTAIPFAGKMMTFIIALRFLTDYLNGDMYFGTSYPGQNLTRARNQLQLLAIMEKTIV
jgi:Ser/Thr protein kinase RdoA (MazF antagonist)